MGEIIVYITVGSEDEAAAIARVLVVEKYAACVNIVRNIRSIYRWEGKAMVRYVLIYALVVMLLLILMEACVVGV